MQVTAISKSSSGEPQYHVQPSETHISPPPKKPQLSKRTTVIDAAIEGATYIPGPIGTTASIVQVGRDIKKGQYGQAAIDSLGIIPVGKYAAKGGKLARNALNESKLFERFSIDLAKQGKHIPTHPNFIVGRGEFLHNDPAKLLRQHAGAGQPVGKGSAGQAGYKERVDFGENIGHWVDAEGKNRLPTTVGIIHYDGKGGAHIVPARPNKP